MTDERLAAMLRALALLQCLDADRRAVVIAPDSGGRGTPDADGARVAQVARGDIERARVVSERLARCSQREAFGWLVEVAHCDWTLDTLALYLASAHGPVADREELASNEETEATATRAANDAAQFARTCSVAHGPLHASAIMATVERTRVEARRDTAARHAVEARARLVAWGRVVIVSVCEEWEATR